MPKHWSGRRRGGCRFPRRRRGMRIMLRPSLLLMLAEQEAHGYELYDRLAEFGFDLERLDSSIVYRDLRDMEELGLIESYWDDDSKGPKRRVYRICEDGEKCLDDSVEVLKEIRINLEMIITRYQAD